jgi:hypothetical protein
MRFGVRKNSWNLRNTNLDRTLKSRGAQDSQNNTNAHCSPERLVRVQSMVAYRDPGLKERLREAFDTWDIHAPKVR